MKRAGTIGVLVLAGFVYVCLNIVQVWSVGRSNDSREVDAIVVMGVAQYDGRPSPQLQARLDHVLKLWNEGVATLVVTTGGNQPGDRFTEAYVSPTENSAVTGGAEKRRMINEGLGLSLAHVIGFRALDRLTN
jgi:hypothetical protein